ncbi:asparagine synthase (glutamine-hydrolyzing) [bacterium]|nr:asparagine synthase (glutamine-hydrolyzing) [bacterium]
MCGIAGILNLEHSPYPNLKEHLHVMNQVQSHRGPDGEGIWTHQHNHVGFAHRRLSIIDLNTGAQPMTDINGNVICYNGEIYNYRDLKKELSNYQFKTSSDTEVILAAYNKWGTECVNHLRGMFAFAIWDGRKMRLFCARDRFGIKPFYYAVINNVLVFASEAKTLLLFLPQIETDIDALNDYLTFQFILDGKTLFAGIHELPAGHTMTVNRNNIQTNQYWEVYYIPDFNHTARYFTEELRNLINESVEYHIVSDVPFGSYLSGGIDSSAITSLASSFTNDDEFKAFTGKFSLGELYDESKYAKALGSSYGLSLHEIEITSDDFIKTFNKVIYHLDYPVAGPGSFPQYHVSKLASQYRKVVLGGQGGDEIFGGYTRYLIAYFEQCIKGAIDGTLQNGNFIVTYESIIPNLIALQNYKPLIREFWGEGLFDDIDKRYYRLINRANTLEKEIRWDVLGDYSPFEAFSKIFNGSNVGKESYLDKMTHFDFKTLLPALLQVEDRMSMAHGLESRVPFLDHPIVEFAATMPSDIKFKDGTLKMVLLNAVRDLLPDIIANRKNKMGFPVPVNEWFKGSLREYIFDIFNSRKAKERFYINSEEVLKGLDSESTFGRKIWGLLSLEVWQQEFHDKSHYYKNLIN